MNSTHAALAEDVTLLRADTGVPTTLRELARQAGASNVLVWSLDAERRLVPAPLASASAAQMAPTYRLRLASGRDVRATGQQSFLMFNGLRRLEALDVGDRIAIPRFTPEPAKVGLGWSEKRLALLAYLIADGTVLPRHVTQIADDDPSVLEMAAEAARDEFGINARLDLGDGSRCPTLYLPSARALTHGVRNPVHQWFSELGIGGLHAWDKRVPDVVFRGDDHEVASFLRHLVATDGCVSVSTAKHPGFIRFDTTSRKLADGIAALLSRFAIVARIKRVPQKRHRDLWIVTISDGPGMRRFAERVGAYGRSAERLGRLMEAIDGRAANTNVDTVPREVWGVVKQERINAGLSERQFQAAIGTAYCGSTLYKACPSRERLLRCGNVLDSDIIRGMATDDVFWDRIVEIESLGERPTVGVSVDRTHCLVADGVLVRDSRGG